VETCATSRSKWDVLAALGVWPFLTFWLPFRLVAVALACTADVLFLATCVGLALMSCHHI